MAHNRFDTRLVLVCIFLTVAAGAQPRIVSVQPQSDSAEQFGLVELKVGVDGEWSNPFDPDEIDIAADFTAPDGTISHVPAFWHQDFQRRVLTPSARRRSVRLLKFYVTEHEWRPGSEVEFFIDDVTLTRRNGDDLVLDDMEQGEATRWGSADRVNWSEDLAHGGERALRYAPAIDAEESWPGAQRVYDNADWSQYDGVSVWVYPRAAELAGPLRLYFSDEEAGNSPIAVFGADTLKLNQWNQLHWDWSDFTPSVAFDAQGDPGWRVRFTPVKPGAYRYLVRASDGASVDESEPATLQVSPSDVPGFVRVSDDDHHYFRFDNGDLFFPIGHDVPWGLDDALEFFPKMAAHGENCTYFIMCPWDMSIEWKRLGEYDLEAAAKLDAYVEAARTNGIYFKLSFDIHDAMRDSKLWAQNPYNAVNGGPCATPNDFYTNADAIRQYRKRLRYLVARWGYSPTIMAWECFAENDGATELPTGQEGWGYPTKPRGDEVSAMLAAWLADTGDFLKEIDPYARLFTASFGGDVSDPNVWQLPQIEYTQIHHYNSTDTAPPISEWCTRLTAAYDKPMMVTEFGWNTSALTLDLDRQGLCLHNGIWASVTSGAAGAAQNWWWQRIDSLGLYPQFRALRRFVSDIRWPEESFRPALMTVTMPEPDHRTPLVVNARASFGAPSPERFEISRDGAVTNADKVPSTLMAPGRAEPRSTPVFLVDFPEAGEFAVHVDTVSPDARLDVYVDGELALRQELPAQGVEGKQCILSKQWQVWECRYNESFAVPIAPGKHEIRVENSKPGFSWLRVNSYTLTNYAPPALRPFGLAGKDTTIIWLQNAESTWGNDAAGRVPLPVKGAELVVQNVPDGGHRVEWWETYSGEILATQDATAVDGKLRLSVPEVERDLACKILRAR